MKLTDKVIRRWIHKKLENYLWKILYTNSYGSRKKLQTISKDLRKILDTFDKMLKKFEEGNLEFNLYE